MSRAATVQIGQTIGDYRIEGILGAGGMGQVYLARDTKLRRTVALKLVDPARQRPEDLIREARLAASLDHPSICTVHGVGYLGDEPFLIMEHIRGVPLSKLIRSRRAISFATALDLARRIVDAVAHAHEHGVVHGDLKSSNIMVGPNDRVTVLDFGLAVRCDEQIAAPDDLETTRPSPSSGAAGTVPYMAPEIIRGQQPSVQSDIWALGVLLFELVAGHRPFCGRTPYELAANILGNQLTPTESLVQGPIRQVIDRCLCVDPADRYESMRDVGDDLSSLSRPTLTAQVENPSSLPV